MIAIAPLTKADFAEWQPLWNGYLGFYRTEVTSQVSALTFERLTGGREPMGAFVAREQGKALGIVHWITHRSCWTVGDYCYLQDLFVQDSARGRGIGRALIEAVYQKARDMQCSRVYWLTHESNTNAMLLYDRIANRSGFLQYRKMLA